MGLAITKSNRHNINVDNMIVLAKLADISITDQIASQIYTLLQQLSPRAKQLTTDTLNGLIKQPGVHTFVAQDNATIIGIVSCVIAALPLKKIMYIEELVVDETYRGQGIGKKLLEQTLALGKQEGVTEVDLTSNPSRTAARALYEKLGLQKAHTDCFRLIIE